MKNYTLLPCVFLFLIIISFSNCKKKVKGCKDSTATNYNSKATEDDGSCTYAPKNVGDSYAGGIVFYVDGTGQHGMVAAPSDQGNSRTWMVSTILATGATGTSVGSGQSNTTAIVNTYGAGTYAAQICNDLVLNGYSDWFLPSRDELLLMYTNLHAKGKGNFAFAMYWCSTEVNDNDALAIDFNSGTASQVNKINSKSVRAARSF